MQLVSSGINVVTLQPGHERVYSQESLGLNPTDLIIALVEMMRAHGESATKSSRLKAAWQAKRGALRERPLTSIAPAWLKILPDRSGFEVIPERAEVVRTIFDQYLAGAGKETIAARLNDAGVAPFGRGEHWRRSYIAKILVNPAVIETFTPHAQEITQGRMVRVPCDPLANYFPAVVDEHTFKAALAMRATAKNITARPRATGVKHLLAGLAKCPLCGLTMTRVTKGSSSKSGRPHIVCSKAKEGAGCKYRAVRVDIVDEAIVRHAGFIAGTAPSGILDLDEKLERAMATKEAVEEAQNNLVEALSRGDSPAIRRRLDLLQVENDTVTREVAALTSEMVTKGSLFVSKNVDEVARVLSAAEVDVPKANAALRRVLDAVTVDYQSGTLELIWHQGGTTSVTYA